MKRVAKWVLIVLLSLLTLVVALGLHTWYAKPLSINWFYGRIFAQYAFQSPEMLSTLRILPPALDFHSNKLDDESPAQADAQLRIASDGLATLKRYDRADLNREGQLSYDTLAFFLQMQAEGEPYKLHNFPVNQLSGVQSSTLNFLTQIHDIKNGKDAENYLARLRQVPVKFDQVLEALKLRESKGIVPPRFTVEKVIAEMRGVSESAPRKSPLFVSFVEKLDKIPASELDDSARDALLRDVQAAISGQVFPAYRKLTAYFVALQPKARANHGAWSLPDGDKFYAWTVRSYTTTSMTPQQIHELGLAEVARIGGEMDAILRGQGLTEGTVGARVQKLANDPAQQFPNTPEGKQAMLARYQELLDEINKGIGAAFDLRPKLGVEVKAVPEFSQATAPGAYYTLGAFDGSRPGIFYANMRAPGETPKFGMRTLSYHEGIPGHHFQVTIAQEMKDVPFFRNVVPFPAYSEGWALYAERLAFEMGFGKEPLESLGRLGAEMMRATRLVVDTGIHYKKWTREQAITYMVDNIGMSEGEATAEVERYFVDPGQALAYKVGMIKILALREHAKKELGDKFDLKLFHNEVLGHGALPLTVLEGVIEDWIAARKKG
jgi:uncharacterized protein (DUF885 family)